MNSSDVRFQLNPAPGLRVLIAIGALTAVALLTPWKSLLLVIAGVAVLVALWYIGASLLCRNAEPLFLTWVGLFPVGYYYLSYPRDVPVISLDRVVIALLVVTIAVAPLSSGRTVPLRLRWTAVVWGLFSVAAILSFLHLKMVLQRYALVLDAFVAPVFLTWYIVRRVNVRAQVKNLHLLVALVSIFCAAVGVAENVLQRDLMPFAAGMILVSTDIQDPTSSILIRANGPFVTLSSYALIGLISFVLLLFLRRAMGDEAAPWRRTVHWIALGCALLQALLPFLRSVVLSLLVVMIIDAILVRGFWKRMAVISVLGVLLAGFLAVRFVAPEVYEDRAKADNLYARIAQQRQTLQLFLDHPILGVGLANFGAAVLNSRYQSTFAGEEAADAPHNNFGAVLAETGLLGFLPYLAANLLLLSAYWQVRRRSADGWAWKYLLYIFLIYAINGLSLNSGYSADLNLWFMFAGAVIYTFAISSPGERSLQTG